MNRLKRTKTQAREVEPPYRHWKVSSSWSGVEEEHPELRKGKKERPRGVNVGLSADHFLLESQDS